MTLTDSTLSQNTVSDAGGGIFEAGGKVDVTGGLIQSNGAYGGGGIYEQGGTLTIVGAIIASNNSGEAGGIFVSDGSVTISDDQISNEGTAIEVGNGASATITNDAITDNGAGVVVGFNPSDTTTATINDDDFTGDSTGVVNSESVGTIDATGNWWGTIHGPSTPLNPGGDGPAVSGNVAITPWIGLYTDGTPSGPGFNPTGVTLYAVPTQLVFTTEPSATAYAGVAFGQQPVLEAEDASGNLGINFDSAYVPGSQVSLTLNAGSYAGTLTGTNPFDASAGFASSQDLRITQNGTYTLSASALPTGDPWSSLIANEPVSTSINVTASPYTVWYVNSTNPGPVVTGSTGLTPADGFPTIQEAIDGWGTTSGNTIYVEDGNGYDETDTVDKSLTIEADSGQTPVNSGNASGVGLTIAPGITAVTITGLTIEHFNTGVVVEPGASLTLGSDTIASNSNLGTINYGRGGGIYDDGGQLTITGGTLIEDNHARFGGGLYISDTIIQITDGRMTSNTAQVDGGGLYASSGQARITGGSFNSNSAGGAGGGIYDYYAPMTIANGTLIDSNKAGYGGGIYIEEGTITITGDTIDSNLVSEYGGGIYDSYGNVKIMGGTIESNRGGRYGGGIYLDEGTMTISEVQISSNSAEYYGGGIDMTGYAQVDITGGVIASNSASDYGGGIYDEAYDGRLTMAGGTLVESNKAYYGAGLYVDYGAVQITGATFASNTASDYGGGIYNYHGDIKFSGGSIKSNSGGDYGGGIENSEATLMIADGTVIENNKSNNGGGIYLYYGTVTITGDTVASNSANDGGGIDDSYGDLKITGGTIKSNAAGSAGGGIYDRGGMMTIVGGTVIEDNRAYIAAGIYIGSGAVTITDAQVASNTAGVQGGGIFNSYGDVKITGGTIQSNAVASAGGGIYDRGGMMTIAGATIEDNHAYNAAGIYISRGTVLIDDAQVASNTAANNGGGLYNSSGSVRIDGGAIESNAVGSAGGGIYDHGGMMTIELGAAIESNHAYNAAGIFIGSGTLQIIDGQVESNTATNDGGGIYNTGDLKISGGAIQSNVAGRQGGGIYDNGALTIVHGVLEGNTANGGGGILVYSGAVTFTGATVESNTARGNGGGIYDYLGDVKITSGAIQSNAAGSNGGGIFDQGPLTIAGPISIQKNTAASGGGIYISGGTVQITDAQVASNTAAYDGGGIFNSYGDVKITGGSFQTNAAQTEGGGIYDRGGMMTIAGPIPIQKNMAESGGGLFVSGGTVQITDAQVALNSAIYDGGGLFNTSGDVKLTGDAITSNAAGTSGGGIYDRGGMMTISQGVLEHNAASQGGGIFASSGAVTITGTPVEFNTAGHSGGGIFDDLGDVQLRDVPVQSNAAGSNGGGIFDQSAALTISSGTPIEKNQASNGGGIFIDRGTVTISDAQIASNTAANGGGLYNSYGDVKITGGTVKSNAAPNGAGGGILEQGGTMTIAGGAVIEGNSAYNGGGLYLASGSFTMTGDQVTSNTATSFGGGLYNSQGNVNISGGAFASNAASVAGGGLYNLGATMRIIGGAVIEGNSVSNGGGGGLFIEGGSVTITGDQVVSNHARHNGGGLEDISGDVKITGGSFKSNGVGYFGGGLADLFGPMTIAGATQIEGNTAFNGGGLYVYLGVVTVTGDVIESNRASYDGGGINDRSGDVKITGGAIDSNTAQNEGGGLFGSAGMMTIAGSTAIESNKAPKGGGIYIAGGTIQITDAQVASNTAGYDGGGIDEDGGMLKVTGCTIDGNTAAAGGGIYQSNGTLTIIESTLADNLAIADASQSHSNYGGGIYAEGSAAALTNDTIAANTAVEGGGIYVGTGTVSLTNDTISANMATDDGGGVDNGAGSVSVVNTIIAANAAGTMGTDVDGTFNSLGYNLIGAVDGSSGFSATGDLTGTAAHQLDPRLAQLGSYGGPTQTMALLPGSPAIGGGSMVSGVTTDQRGFPLDMPTPDIGAFQSQTTLVVNTTGDFTSGPSGELSLRQAINLANLVNEAETITFDPNVFATPQTITLTEGPLNLTDTGGAVTITGPAAGVTVSGGGASSDFDVDMGATLSISNMTITGASGFYGGGIYNSGTVTLTDDTITGNSAYEFGGGIFNVGMLTLTDDTVSGNSAGSGGGIANFTPGKVTLVQDTFSGNSARNGGGAISDYYGTVTLTNDTISGNSASSGGGIYVESGTLTLTNDTISGNSGMEGGGIVNAGQGPVNVVNSIIAGNSASSTTGQDVSGLFNSDGHNLIGIADGSTGFDATGDVTGTGSSPLDPRLAPLGNYGGPTQTTALMGGSPALGGGSLVSGVTTDQRGFPLDMPIPDIGAFQNQATLVVNTTSDGSGGPGLLTLRQAINLANAVQEAETIHFAPTVFATPQTITLTQGQLELSDTGGAVTISGPAGLTVSGGGEANNTVFDVDMGVTASISDVTITGGNGGVAGGGGGVFNLGTLTLTDDTITNNVAYGQGGGVSNHGTMILLEDTISENSGGGLGGGIINSGTMTLTDTTVSNNSVFIGGGIFNGGTMTLTNATVSGNSAEYRGGGLENSGGMLMLINTTVSGNSAGYIGGGIYNETYNQSYGPVMLVNTIIAGNSAGSLAPDLEGSFDSQGYNLIGITDGSTGGDFEATGDLTGTAAAPLDPMLAPLGSYGGPTQTMALLPGSPALGGGSMVSGVTTDQRGFPLDMPTPDIGAFQNQAILVVNTTSDGNGGPGLLTLRQAINLANVLETAETIHFDPTVFATPQTITLTQGQLELSDTGGLVTINGPAAGLTVSGGGVSRVFQVEAGVTASISGATITGGAMGPNGYGQFANGGGVLNDGTLTLTDDIVSGNTGGQGGGVDNAGTLILTDDTVSGNTSHGGGGIYNSGMLMLDSVTIAGNSAALGGGVFNTGIATLTDDTVSGNTSINSGGGIDNTGTMALTNVTVAGNTSVYVDAGGIFSGYGGSSLTLTNVTVSDNSAYDRGGVSVFDGTATLVNTIIAGNTVSTTDPDVYGDFNSEGYNLIGITDGSTGFGATGDLTGTAALPLNPLLAALGDYGGPTETTSLLPGSPAIDAGTTSVATDQRGVSRPQGPAPDIGAFESRGFTIAVTSGGGQSANANQAFANPLVATVTANDPNVPVAGGLVTFTAPASGASASLSGSPATIAANGTASITATANGVGGSYSVLATTSGVATAASFGLTNIVLLTPTFSHLTSPTIVYGTPTTILTGHIGSGTSYPSGSSVSITLNSVTQTAPVDASGDFTTTFSTAALGVSSSPYTVTYFFAGNANFGSATDTSTTLTVTPAMLAITANNDSKTYGTLKTFTSTAFSETGLVTANGDTITSVTETSTGSPVSATVAGSPYSIVPGAAMGTGLSNYTIHYVNGALTVNTATLTITANSTSKTYGTVKTFASTAFMETGLVTANGDTITGVTETSTGSPASAPVAGSPYPIVPSAAVGTGLGNYTIAYVNGNLTVNAAGLTVTATAGSMTYGGTVPALAYTYSGLVNHDASASFNGTLATTAMSLSNVGGYPISQGTLAATGNYTITTFIPATLTVNPAPLTVTANGASMSYGGTVPALTYTYTGQVVGGTTPSFTGSLATAATSSSNAGSYPITQGTLAATGNYTIVMFIPTIPTVGDAGFETPSVGSGYQYNPPGAPWTFSGGSPNGSGVAGNNSAFTSSNPVAPQGTQVGFIQEHGTITQMLAGWSAGTFTMSFYAAQRANYGIQNFEVLVDGNVVGTFRPTTTQYQLYSTSPFTVPAGVNTIEFVGLDTTGGDCTDFIDAVSLTSSIELTVNPDNTTTTATTSSSTTDFGQAMTLTATVASSGPGAGTPAGAVDFYDATTSTDLGSVALSGGVAALTTTLVPAGTNAITPIYSGGGNFQGSSGSVSQSVLNSVYILNSATPAPSLTGTLYLSSSAAINVPGRIVVNSPASPAVTLTGTSQLVASGIQVVGTVTRVGAGTTVSPTPVTGSQYAVTDPLATLAIPSVSGTATSINLTSGSQTISPGLYSQIKLSGTASLTLNPGVYVITGGGISVTNTASITGSGVMLYNAGTSYPTAGGTYTGVAFNTTGTVNLSAPATGTYAGILIFQAAANASAMSIAEDAAVTLNGVIYGPVALLTLTGGGAQLNGSMVLSRLTASGTTVANALTLDPPAGSVAYSPAQVRSAYGIDKLSTPLDGTGQTIAIVDAYDDPDLLPSVDAFDTQFGLTASGPSLFQQYGPAWSFLTVLNQDGQATSLPGTDPSGAGAANWEMEEALDVEWIHATAPGAQIILVEANSQSLSDLMASVAIAAGQPGVSVVSMSWGFAEGQAVFAQDEAAYDPVFDVPGVTFVASTGDYGAADPEYPAFSPNVVAVGGTSLTLNGDGSYNSETGWGYESSAVGAFIGSGGGISLYEPEPSYQQGVQSTGYRTTPDVSLVADPDTGAWVADLYNQPADSPFEALGGTSLSSPAWAGMVLLANQARSEASLPALDSSGPTETLQAFYSLPQADYNAVDSGTNGYNAESGYNLVTGLGTPVANRLISALAAYQGAGTTYSGPKVGPLQDASLSGVGTGGESTIDVFSVFDSMTVGGVGARNRVGQVGEVQRDALAGIARRHPSVSIAPQPDGDLPSSTGQSAPIDLMAIDQLFDDNAADAWWTGHRHPKRQTSPTQDA